MFQPTKKQLSSLIGLTALLSIFAILAYAAVFFSPATQPVGYIGQPTLSNYNVTSGNEHVYRGMYNNSDWSGQFSCYPVTSTGYVDLASPCFIAGAGSPLDVQAAAGTRFIGTLTDSATPAGVEFSTTGLTPTQQGALSTTTSTIATTSSTANINWIRGFFTAPATISTPTTNVRSRTTALGDIVHSRPYYWPDKAHSGANPTVFVGANDGMLHAFDASTGNERWAYVPSMLIPKMVSLPSTGYVHDYFVDGSIAIANVPLAGTSTPVLVGALGAGGKGLYALSLATLTAASGTATGAKALWEITNTTLKCGPASSGCTSGATTAYANLGDTYSNPVIVPTQDGNTSVIVGNGYNNKGNGHATLYVINAATGARITEIDTGVGSTTSPNGLSSVTVIDSNGDGKGDRAYAGDINGNMWIFDLSSSTPSSWQVATVSGTTQQPLYSVPQGSAPQPIAITIAPAISLHPWGGYMVNFATGRILSTSGAGTISPSTSPAIDDITDRATPNAAYGLWDNPSLHTTIPISSLITQSTTTSTYIPPTGSTSTTSITVVNLTTDNKPNWSVNRGWVVPLTVTVDPVTGAFVGGDRVTGDGVFVDAGKFQFNVTNPTVAYTPTGSSVASNGVNYLVELDYLTGGAGTLPFMDLNQDNLFNSSDLLTSASTTPLAASLIPVGYITSNGVQSQPILIQLAASRVPLYNQNFYASMAPKATGVNGGHFDVDVFVANAGNQCNGGTLSAAGNSCTGVCSGGTLNSAGTGCASGPSGTFVAGTPASCSGGTLASSGTSCAVVGTFVSAVAAVSAKCTNGTLNSGSTGCISTVFSAATCTNGTLNTNKTACNSTSFTAATCTNGTLNAGNTACNNTSFTAASCTKGGSLQSNNTKCSKGTFTAASCSGGNLNSTNSACMTTTFTAASCTGGTVNSTNTACMTTTFAAPSCSNGGTLNSGLTACLTPSFTAAVAAVAAKCTGGTLNGNSTACTAPGSFVTATTASCSGGTLNSNGTACTTSTPGTYSPIGTYVSNGTAGFKKVKHVHEYDKSYDTNGLNILNPNDTTYRFSAIPGMTATTPYKILVMNQAWNRAMNLRIGTWSGRTRDYQTMLSTDVITNYATSNCTGANSTNLGIGCLDVVNLPSFTGTTSQVGHWTGSSVLSTSGTDYTVVPAGSTTDIVGKVTVVNVVTSGSIGCTSANGVAASGCTSTSVTSGARATVGGLELSMPNDGFNIQDWWNDGVVSTGVMPITPSCAYGVNSADGSMPSNSGGNFYTGTSGERHDGVLTVQIIRANTPNADVRMNVPGKPIYGFRVIDSKNTTDVIAEYTLYWHHPNSECMGDGSTSTWATTNNEGDPWWPAQEVVKATGNGAFVSSTSNSTSKITTMGDLTCVTGGANNATGNSPTWNTTTSPTAYTAAITSPYSGALGSSANGPAGWTISPPQDSAATLPICPSYQQIYDDPRTASFVNTSAGQNNSTGSNSGTVASPPSAALSSGMGGRPPAAVNSSGGTGGTSGTGTGAASGVSAASTGSTSSSQTGTLPVSGRISWRELIGL